MDKTIDMLNWQRDRIVALQELVHSLALELAKQGHLDTKSFIHNLDSAIQLLRDDGDTAAEVLSEAREVLNDDLLLYEQIGAARRRQEEHRKNRSKSV